MEDEADQDEAGQDEDQDHGDSDNVAEQSQGEEEDSEEHDLDARAAKITVRSTKKRNLSEDEDGEEMENVVPLKKRRKKASFATDQDLDHDVNYSNLPNFRFYKSLSKEVLVRTNDLESKCFIATVATS